jgi:hypothetical protein
MGLHLLFLPNFPVATFIHGATFILDSRVLMSILEQKNRGEISK